MTRATLRGRQMPERPMAFVAVALAIIVTLLAVAGYANLQANDASNRVTRSLAVSDVAERLLGVIRDGEIGQRGYLLTGDDSYLVPYRTAVETVGSNYGRLLELVEGKPDQVARVTELKGPIDSKMAELTQTVSMTQATDRAGALSVIKSGSGKLLMDDIRSRTEEIETIELDARRVLGGAEAQGRVVVLVAFVVAVTALVGFGWWLMRLGQRRAGELERRVQERTEDLQKEQSRVELLLHDMNHRVGNNLSVIAAILGMQRRRSSEPEVQSALAAAEERIAAIGSAQRRLRLSLDSDEVEGRQFFHDLAEDLRQTCEGRPIDIATDIDDVRLPGREAVTYGVLVNELMTNAIKHAFPDGASGTVTLRVKMPAPGSITVEVVDDGIGMPGGDGKGLGTTILSHLARSLDAEVHAEAAAPGTARPGLRAGFTAAGERIAANA